ncbi:protein translocase subunit SecD [Cellulomonas chengniuliangii]|uniref:Protein translocase subunit SecD n=1 Tax=Cellulomonas chengniuliangii TaxID=2968084 RepID=A0ABY5L2B1_9CELL|nr:protein translocase subunit SecD [Cellulomonas chengniuliangii]MCC2308379.1 protein translocase subunit SecD [Cellulomonas chengniuliangii]MCC2317396.1 protein translocase subunit SecD [Cellulomonas chengniuliangii]UUI76947.1 protein translocase subunit SecD [Cellulomonas chengniuliangii]
MSDDAAWTPKLALDLEGGTQLILTAVTENNEPITSETISQAINVIRQRVDSSGVAEAEITSQGGRNIVVSLPGSPSEETIALVSKSAQMTFRPVLAIGAPQATSADGTTDGATAPPSDETAAPADGATDGAPEAEEATPPSDTPSKAAPDSPSDVEYYVTPAVESAFDSLDCTNPDNLIGGEVADPDKALATCDEDGTAKYLLGPVEIKGSEVSSATSGLRTTSTGATTNEWVVDIKFNSEGTKLFRDTTTRLQSLAATPPQNQFAMVLDGLVISAPSLDAGVIISNGEAQISGSFNRESAATLANQLNFGALPLTFDLQSQEQISATLGTEQLQKGLIAGAIGLLLVVIYSLFQYRALGLVTVASLLIAGIVTYGVIAVLSWTQGYRLSLPGVAGLIVAIGITADSFIVYFERIRDELRDGRSLAPAVDRGWDRARRTILASDAVNFLAAVVLYFLAVGGVRGFAFTLGLTTLIDLLVVFFFTHPLMTLLARTRFFASGHRFSGLDPRRLGAAATRYVGRGKVVPGAATAGDAHTLETPGSRVPVAAGVRSGAATMTIAERRAAERAAAQGSGSEQTARDEPQPGHGRDKPDGTTPPDASGERGSDTTEGTEN